MALTLGNAEFTDLMVESPNRQHFDVDVKGQSTKSYWMIKQREPYDNRYFILVYVPRDSKEAPQYFVISSTEMAKLIIQERDDSHKKQEEKGMSWAPKDNRFSGIKWIKAFEYTDWGGVLPK